MAERDGVGRWLEAAGRVPLLTHREELELGRLVRAWQDWPGGADLAPAVVVRRGPSTWWLSCGPQSPRGSMRS